MLEFELALALAIVLNMYGRLLGMDPFIIFIITACSGVGFLTTYWTWGKDDD